MRPRPLTKQGKAEPQTDRIRTRLDIDNDITPTKKHTSGLPSAGPARAPPAIAVNRMLLKSVPLDLVLPHNIRRDLEVPHMRRLVTPFGGR